MPRFRRKRTVLQDAKEKKSAPAQSKQIQTLARQVDNLKEANREHSTPVYYKMSYSSRTNAYPLVVPLTAGPSPASVASTNNSPVDDCKWIKTFNYAEAVSASKQNLKLYSQYVDVILEPGNEEDILIHTFFLVKLRNEEDRARRTYRQTTSMTVLTPDNDYCTNTDRDGAQAWLNADRYEIIKRWELHTCGDEKVEPTPGASGIIQNFSGAINRFGFKINYSGRQLKVTGTSTQISDLIYAEITPESKYFLIGFSDNSTIDLENPLLSVSSIVKARMF
ncbi:MAG: putative capsid protein [Cressdnaviricota sp.]|nr:MAG: putative capsid protein [Cressdnaviricota sp.]